MLCCADWFTPVIGIGDSWRSFSDDETPDGDLVDPGWHASDVCTGADTVVHVLGNFGTCPDGMVYQTCGSGDENYGCAYHMLTVVDKEEYSATSP